MAKLFDEAKVFLEKAKANKAEYEAAAKKALDALDKAKPFLEKLRAGDFEGAQVQLTKWEDVNKTLLAVEKMDKAKYEVENGVGLEDVLRVVEVIGKVVTIGVGVAAIL